MGADKAVHVVDDGAGRLGRAGDLGGAGRGARQTGFDLVILGSESTDARTGWCRRCWPSGSACRS